MQVPGSRGLTVPRMALLQLAPRWKLSSSAKAREAIGC